jgi:hypothetical protein
VLQFVEFVPIPVRLRVLLRGRGVRALLVQAAGLVVIGAGQFRALPIRVSVAVD